MFKVEWKKTVLMMVLSGIFLQAASCSQLRSQPALEPSMTRQINYDLNGDGRLECYSLDGGCLHINQDERVLWVSPSTWGVYSYVLGDSNNDGSEELLLLLWKTGSYGRDKPFWFTGFDDDWSNHLFVYRLVNDELKPVWCSSALPRPIEDLGIADIDQDGKNELLVSEGYFGRFLDEKAPLARAPNRLIMRWQGWGFYEVE